MSAPFFLLISADVAIALDRFPGSPGVGRTEVPPGPQVQRAEGRQNAIGVLENRKFSAVDRAGFGLLDQSVAGGQVGQESLTGGKGFASDLCRQVQLLG